MEGSPPLTRGILRLISSGCSTVRFTPAHAGNTLYLCFRSTGPEVHPRSRGEYVSLHKCGVSALGSPPLTRGILLWLFLPSFRKRFTPAHAGNTRSIMRMIEANRVHPRSRGEYGIQHRDFRTTQGSPPLTRGIRQKQAKKQRMRRFTPAHAGNTTVNGPYVVIPQVHPRSRGEYRLFIV